MTSFDFANLEKIASDLSAKPDETTRALFETEEKINSLHLGIEVYLGTDEYEIPGAPLEVYPGETSDLCLQQ